MGKKHNILRKVFTAMIILLFVVGCGIYTAVRPQKTSDEQGNQFAVSGATDNPLLNQTLALYYDAGRIFLKADLKQTEIDAISKALPNGNKQKEITVILEDIQQRFDVQTEVNSLFDLINDKSPLNGPILQHYVLVKENMTQESIDAIKATYQDQLPKPKAAEDAADGLYTTVAFLIAEAEKQLTQLKAFNKQIADLKKNQELTYEELTQILDDCRKEIAALENPYVKARLIKIVGETDRQMTKQIGQNQINEARNAGADESELSVIEAIVSEQDRIAEERYENDLKESSDFIEAVENNDGEDLSQENSNYSYDHSTVEQGPKLPIYDEGVSKTPINGAESEKPAKAENPVQSEKPSGSEKPREPEESAKPEQPVNEDPGQSSSEKDSGLESKPEPKESNESAEPVDSSSETPELPNNSDAGKNLVNRSLGQLLAETFSLFYNQAGSRLSLWI